MARLFVSGSSARLSICSRALILAFFVCVWASDGAAQTAPIRVLHSASFYPSAVSPGQLISIFGEGLGPAEPVSATLDSNGLVASSLGGVEVSVGGFPAPLLYVSEGQVNAQAPFEIDGLARVNVQVRFQNRVVGERHVDVVPAVVWPFWNPFYTRKAVALNQDGSLNSPARPARPGEIVAFYGTGHGSMTPSETGRPIDLPLATLTHPIEGYFSTGRQTGELEILYGGPAPGMIGVWQVNARVPTSLRRGFTGALQVGLRSEIMPGYAPSYIAVAENGPNEYPDYYIADFSLSKTDVTPGEKVHISFTVANMGIKGRFPFQTRISFENDTGRYGSFFCDHEGLLSSLGSSTCSGDVTVPENMPYGAGHVVLDANLQPRGDVEWNFDNNALAMRLNVVRADGSEGSVLPRVLVIQGPLTVNGRTAEFSLENLRLLSGEDRVLGFSMIANDPFAPLFFIENSGPASRTGDVVTVPVSSEQGVFNGKTYFWGKGTLRMTLPVSASVGSTVRATITLTYRDGFVVTAEMNGTIRQLER